MKTLELRVGQVLTVSFDGVHVRILRLRGIARVILTVLVEITEKLLALIGSWPREEARSLVI